jgi:ATP-dependent 26S proteasome regulatory subunit
MENLSLLIKAKFGIIQIISHETLRVHGLVADAAIDNKKKWFIWDQVLGLREWKSNGFVAVNVEDSWQPQPTLDWFEAKSGKDAILILEDFHVFLQGNNDKIIRRLRNIAFSKFADRTLILCQPFLLLPKELEKEVHIIDLALPEVAQLTDIYNMVRHDYHLEPNEPDAALIQAALGLTIMEAHRAFSQAVAQTKQLTSAEVSIIISEKEQIIKKSGFLEYYHPKVGMKDIGGLENLKDWLKKRGRGFNIEAEKFGLKPPRGVLLLGIPGTGKSLAAKAIGSEWQFPLLRLDMGRIFGGIVGESERNIRQALQVVEALSPSILWIDEIEKGLSGVQSSGASDGGTTSRVLGTFLTWMQEKQKPVFVVATANDISKLPPELLRKGRFDELFFVDLPQQKARIEIFKIHLSNINREDSFSEVDLAQLSEITIGYSGAEIEESIKEALFEAYDMGEDLAVEHIIAAVKATYPLSKIMSEAIKDMRAWAKARAKFAAAEEVLETNQIEENIPRLAQEYQNPFIKKS